MEDKHVFSILSLICFLKKCEKYQVLEGFTLVLSSMK